MASPRERRTGSESAAACPKCGSDKAPKRPSFTWWGGMLGPKLFHHAICLNCGTGYNAKTGKSNLGPIVGYTAVAFAIAMAILVALRR